MGRGTRQANHSYIHTSLPSHRTVLSYKVFRSVHKVWLQKKLTLACRYCTAPHHASATRSICSIESALNADLLQLSHVAGNFYVFSNLLYFANAYTYHNLILRCFQDHRSTLVCIRYFHIALTLVCYHRYNGGNHDEAGLAPMQDEDKLLTTNEVADILRVHITTVRRMLRNGVLKYIEIAPREYRVRRTELDKFLRERERKGSDS
jgi:excisionase family DNA binding protein